jgi:hypothetical protein
MVDNLRESQRGMNLTRKELYDMVEIACNVPGTSDPENDCPRLKLLLKWVEALCRI